MEEEIIKKIEEVTKIMGELNDIRNSSMKYGFQRLADWFEWRFDRLAKLMDEIQDEICYRGLKDWPKDKEAPYEHSIAI